VTRPTSPLAAMAALRDKVACDGVLGSEICGPWTQVSVLFQPAARCVWVTNGSQDSPIGDVFCELDLGEILPGFPRKIVRKYARRGARQAPENTGVSVESLPLVDVLAEQTDGVRLVAEAHVDPAGDPFLVQHRFKDRPMMPLAVMIEMLAEAAALLAGSGRQVAAVRDVDLVSGLKFQSDEVHPVRIEAVAAGAEIACQVTCDVRNRRGDVLLKDKPHMRGVVELTNSARGRRLYPASTAACPPADPTRWVRCFYTEKIVIHHGPVFRGLRAIAVDGEYSWGQIVPRPIEDLSENRGEGWLSNPMLLDACFYACGSMLWLKNRGIIAVPDGIDRLRFGRFPRAKEKCVVTIRDRGRSDNRTTYDFTVTGDDGDVLVDVVGYRNLVIAEEPARPDA
jgi:hypothetical protein